MGDKILPKTHKVKKTKAVNPNSLANLRKFQPGQSGNPAGKAKQDPAIKAFKETTYRDFLNSLQKYGAMDPEDLKVELEKPGITVFEVMFGNIVQGAMKGDKDSRNVLLERLWGKVTEKHEVADLRKELADVSDERLIDLVKEA